MKQFCDKAINYAKLKGASYADIRVISSRKQKISVVRGSANLDETDSLGYGIRVIFNGSWGFSASNDMTTEALEKTVEKAVNIAKAASRFSKYKIQLSKEPAYVDKWSSTYLVDPFTVPIEEKLELLYAIDEKLREDERVVGTYVNMDFWDERQWFANSEGAFIDQNLLRTGTGYSVTAIGNGEIQRRSYPASFGGQYQQCGYELVGSLKLLENADRIREEAIALLTAPELEYGQKDIILEGSQLALQIHESIGHPSELDRVLGQEANYAGRSFVTTDIYKDYHYGSELMNIVADSTIPGGLATFGYDDDGVRAQRYDVIKEGRYKNYFTNRELAHEVGEDRSRGCNRADGYTKIPMVRMINVGLVPGETPYEEMIESTEDGVLLSTVKTWSIDQMRLNFQFTTEIGHVIKNGKITGIVKAPTYQGITPKFWKNLDAVADQDSFVLWGVPNCGKGQPGQTAEISHGCSPARFKNITVGINSNK